MFVSRECNVNNFEHKFDPNAALDGKDWTERSPEGDRGRKGRPGRSLERCHGHNDRPVRSPEGRLGRNLRHVRIALQGRSQVALDTRSGL